MFVNFRVQASPCRVDTRAVAASEQGIRGLGAAIETLLVWLDRVRERNWLTGIDERMLKDIGLSRADLMRETDKRFWQA